MFALHILFSLTNILLSFIHDNVPLASSLLQVRKTVPRDRFLVRKRKDVKLFVSHENGSKYEERETQRIGESGEMRWAKYNTAKMCPVAGQTMRVHTKKFLKVWTLFKLTQEDNCQQQETEDERTRWPEREREMLLSKKCWTSWPTTTKTRDDDEKASVQSQLSTHEIWRRDDWTQFITCLFYISVRPTTSVLYSFSLLSLFLSFFVVGQQQ